MAALRSGLVLGMILALTGSALAQPLPAQPDAVGEPVNQLTGTAVPLAENQTGEDLSSEQIDVTLVLDVENAEFDLRGALLGGGKVQTDVEVRAKLAIYAVNVSRLETALNESTERSDVTLNRTFGVDTDRAALTAEEIRSVAGGELLRAFRPYQEEATVNYIEDTLPQVTVLTAAFEWSNTKPAQDERSEQEATIRDPPIVLEATVRMQFLDRVSIVDLVEDKLAANETGTTKQEKLRQQIEENQTEPFLQRDAPKVLGVGQLLSLDLPPGWRLNFTMEVPKGYTIASATDALEVTEDQRTARYFLDGSQRATTASTSGVVKLSDRSLVATTLVTGAGIAGALLRIPAEMAAFAIHRRLES